MKNQHKTIINFDSKIMIIRYLLIVILIAFFLSNIFNIISSNFVTRLSYYFLQTFTQVKLVNLELIFPDGSIFLVIKECLAASAYILITLVFLSIPIDLKIIIKSILGSYIVFTIFNILRIFILMFVHVRFGEQIFDLVHLAFYEFISGIGAGIIIIYYLYKYKIKKIYPFFSDIKYLILEISKLKLFNKNR